MLMQNLGGQTKSIMVFSEMSYSTSSYESFESVFAFFGTAKRLGLQNDANQGRNLFEIKSENARERRFKIQRIYFDQKYFENRNVIMKVINYIEEDFDLTFINSHYDESLMC